jgi:hypothetical protein
VQEVARTALSLPKAKSHEEKSQIGPAFKPVLSPDIEITPFKEDERGKFYLVKNKKNLRFLKVHEDAYEALRNFTGANTIADMQHELEEKGVPLDLLHLTEILAERGFLENFQTSGPAGEHQLLSYKIRVFRLRDDQLDKLCRFFSFAGNRLIKILVASFLMVGLSLFLYNLPHIISDTIAVMSPKTALEPLLLTVPIFLLGEVVHELAHAATYRHYGGTSVDMGFEFHFLIPFFYTGTPELYQMKTREKIAVLIAGPCVSLILAEFFTCLYVINPNWRLLWGVNAFYWNLSTLVTLTPIIQTDGYFIAQSVLKFPNLLDHGMQNLIKFSKLLFRRISTVDYHEYLSQYSDSERKILKVYTPILLVGVSILIGYFVVLALDFQVATVILLTPMVLSGAVLNLKTYLLWIVYIANTIILSVGIIGTLLRSIRR